MAMADVIIIVIIVAMLGIYYDQLGEEERII